MNTHVCQNCGSILRRLSSKCSGCGNVVTKYSSTEFKQLSSAPAPHSVAVLDDPIKAESVLLALNHEKQFAAAKASSAIDIALNLDAEAKTNSSHSVDALGAIIATAAVATGVKKTMDFFAEVAPVLAKNETVQAIQSVIEPPLAASAKEEVPTENDTSVLMQRLLDANQEKEMPAREDFFDHLQRKAVPINNEDEDDFEERSLSEKRQSQTKKNGTPFEVTKALLIAFGSGFALLVLLLSSLLFLKAPDSASTVSNSPTLDGLYSYSYQNKNGSLGYGSMTLHQNGDAITGEGDDAGRTFIMKGSFKAPYFKLLKRYRQSNGLNLGQAIAYEGALSANPPKKYLDGNWYFDSNSSFARQKLLSAKMPFHAELRKGGAPEQTASSKNWFWALFWNENEPLAARFMKISLALILSGFGIFLLSLRFFGRHGLLNRWEREKYIPHQLKGEHLRLMRQMGGSAKPGSLYLGERVDWGIQQFNLPRKLYLHEKRRERNSHVLVMGAGSKGKSRLLASMAVDDIKSADRAVVIIDSEGGLVELLSRWLCSAPDAKNLLSRVNIIDPCRKEANLGFNPLIASGREAILSAASAVLMGFKAVYTESQNQQNQWNQQTADILRHAVILLMLNERNLEDLPALLSDNDFRDLLLQHVEKNMPGEWDTLLRGWANYKKLARSEQWLTWIEPILNRVQPLLSDPRIHRLLNTRENCIDLAKVIEEKRILLVRVPGGQLDKGGNLLGSLIVTGLKQSGILTYENSGESVKPCALYLDEMNHFIDVAAFDSICTDSRKVPIGIHGSLKTLQDLSEEYRNKVTLNFGTMALFAISKKDADILGPSMFPVDGRTMKIIQLKDIFNPVNNTPNMNLASDEEKINTNRLLGQGERVYFCNLVGTEAGVFRMKAPEFKDIHKSDVNWDLMDSLYEEQDSQEDA